MKEKMMAFIAANPVCTLATCDSGQPRVRGFLTNMIDETIYFTTSAHKNVGRQLQADARIELCYLSGDFATMLRVEAVAHVVDDRKIKQHLIDTRDYLAHFSADDPEFLLFTPAEAKAHFWTLADNLNEAAIARVALV